MKRLLFLAFLLLPFTFNACQCSEKPDVGPVEDATHEAPATPRTDA
ncbi:MAG: hypothetical protein R3247_00225 [Rhodothermales bacterium]|nr:hypothetical protein [Rhodothermales bacterium]